MERDASEAGQRSLKRLGSRRDSTYSQLIAVHIICEAVTLCIGHRLPCPFPGKPSKDQIAAARDKVIPDLAAKDLIVLFAGINPGLYTAAIGRHFGRPGNRFLARTLRGAGFTPRLFSPFEGSLLLDLQFGITNIVERATARADELTDEELRAGGRRLKAKVRRWRPTVVAFVGIQPYRVVSGIRDARVGLQEALFGGSHAWVLPNPSGLNAHYLPAALAQLFGALRIWAIAEHRRRQDRSQIKLR